MLVLGLLWITLEYFALGPYSYFRIHDNGNITIPALLTQSASYFDHSLWYPFAGGGADRLALGLFSGLDLLLFKVLPGWLAYQILVISQFVLATVFTYLLARRTLGLASAYSAIAGFAYALSVASGQFAFSAMSYLPFVIWGLSRALASESFLHRWGIVGGLALLYGLTSHVQLLLPFPFVVILLWFWLVEEKVRPRELYLILVFCALTIALRAPDIVAMAANGGLSHRYDWGADTSLAGIVQRSISHVYWNYWRHASGTDGVLIAKVTLVIFLLGVLIKQVRSPTYFKLLAFGIFLVLAPVAAELISFLLGDVLPILTKYSFLRFHFYLFLVTAVGAAYVLAHLPDGVAEAHQTGGPDRRLGLRRLAFFAAVLLLAAQTVVVKIGHGLQWLEQGSYVSAYRSPLARDLAQRHASEPPFRVATIQGNPAFMHAYGLETVDGYLTLYPRRYKAFWERVIARYLAKSEDARDYLRYFGSHFYLFEGSEAPRLKFRDNYNLALLSLANTRFIFSRNALIDDALVPIAQPDHPWSELTIADRRTVQVEANFSGWRRWYVYENKGAFPRFFLAQRMRALPDADSVLDAISSATERELRSTAFVTHDDVNADPAISFGYRQGSVEVLDYGPDRIELSVSADGWSVLVGSNTYSPYWNATLDGQPVPIFPVDHAFWGVTVGPGTHRIVFDYLPPQRLSSVTR
jgi:hypothetical protein